MAHIIILEELKTTLEQANVYSHAIAENLSNNNFHGSAVTTATALQSQLETLVGDINDRFRSDLNDLVSAQETLLGI